MTTLESRRKTERGYVPRTALARAVEFSSEAMQVFLTDGRILSVPLLWFPRLWAATPEQRTQVEIGGGGGGLALAGDRRGFVGRQLDGGR